MQTVLEVLGKSAEFLARKGLGQPRLEAELLLANAMGCKRLDLYLRFDKPLDEAVLAGLREQVARRGRREPLQYITGRGAFMDFDVACDRRALIPRPETEGLAELVFSKVTATPSRALDLGTGTGVLAFAMARRWTECAVTAVDASDDALSLARANAEALGLAARVTFTKTRWFEDLEATGPFDVVVSNPPYLTDAELASAEPEVRDWEPRGALVAGDDGLADVRKILREAPAFLAPGGLLALETGPEQHAALAAEIGALRKAGSGPTFARHESAKDLSRRDRYFLAWRG